MFTGIIEGMGEVVSVSPSGDGIRLRVRLGPLAAGLAPGASIAVDGACLTATEIPGADAVFDAGEETIQRTTLGQFRAGRRVNLERPLTPQSFLGGHFVQGHVDGIGRIAGIVRRPGGWIMEMTVPAELGAQMVPKGSVAMDGVSLTIVEAAGARFTVFLIPHTYERTTLGSKRVGHAVNIETDIIGKYVARYLSSDARCFPTALGMAPDQGPSGLTEEKLKEQGFA
jgi:riboflavin synthase